jgi:t-SNARE complex subunit (syntaxin)
MNAAIALRPIRQTGNSELWVATALELLPLRARKGSQNGGRVVQKARWYRTRWGITTIVIIIILIIGVVVGSVVSSTWRHT